MTQWVLGLGFSHDASAYLLADGEPVVGVQLERLSRRKHDEGTARGHLLIEYVLGTAGITLSQLDKIGVHAPGLHLADQLKVGGLDLSAENVVHVGHHLCHAYSAFGPSNFDSAVVVVIDGNGDPYYESDADVFKSGPERKKHLEELSRTPPDTSIPPRFETESIYRFDRSGGELLRRGYMQHGRRFSSTARWTDILGIGLNYGEVASWLFGSRHSSGKVMGLAPWAGGNLPSLPPAFVKRDDAIVLDDAWKAVVREQLGRDAGLAHDFDWAARLAFFVQESTEELVLDLVRTAFELTPERRLCMAGGVALNATTNGRIEEGVDHEGVFVQPASSDAGLSIGAALAADHLIAERIRGSQPRQDSTGRAYSRHDIRSALAGHADAVEEVRTPDTLSTVAHALADGQVVGWFEGGSEFGPRALGHRSILADPRRGYMRDHLNNSVKKREAFRPFAPAILSEHWTEWFEDPRRNFYMLSTSYVQLEKRKLVPSIVHVDGSARPQAVPPEAGQYRKLIEAFYRITSVPMVIDTSFNCAGAPIVESPEDALAAYLGMTIDLLYLDGVLLRKREAGVQLKGGG